MPGEAIKWYFPLKKAKRKTSDPPWMNKQRLHMIADHKRISRQEEGVRTSNRPTMVARVEHVWRAFRSCYWTLVNLTKNGFTEDELVKVYKIMIRPVTEYAAVVYHSSLTDEQDELLDQSQKCIFGQCKENAVSGRPDCLP